MRVSKVSERRRMIMGVPGAQKIWVPRKSGCPELSCDVRSYLWGPGHPSGYEPFTVLAPKVL